MNTAKDIISDLLHREHIGLMQSLADARSERELRILTEQALAFASSLLVSLEPTGQGDGHFMGIPFRLVETPEAFWTALWPELRDAHAIISPDPKPTKATDDDLEAAAGALRDLNLIVLCREGPAAKIVGPILVLDINLTTAQQLVSFLFHIVLKRGAVANDFDSLTNLTDQFNNDETREKAIHNIFFTVLMSDEARTKGEHWRLV